LNNFEISDIMRNQQGFAGVMMNDEIPKNIPKNKIWNAVVNIQDSTAGNGTHWCAIYYDPNAEQCEYFDSYGMPPTQQVEKLMKTTGKLCVYSDVDFQRLGTNSCGYFACFYIMKRNKGYQPYEIFYTLHQGPSAFNEQEVYHYCEIDGEGMISDAVNWFIKKSPFELHLPGYQFAGPGTKFAERDARGERGINKLDNAAYFHDKVYNQYPEGSIERYRADLELLRKAQDIGKDTNEPWLERFYANNIVVPAMNMQSKSNLQLYQSRSR